MSELVSSDVYKKTIIIFIPLNFIIHERKNIPLFSANKYLIYFLKEQLNLKKKKKWKISLSSTLF